MIQDEIIDRDEVLKMARQAGFLYGTMGPSNTRFVTAIGHTFTVELEAFAKLVTAQATAKAVEREREACAKVCETLLRPTATDFMASLMPQQSEQEVKHAHT